MDLDKQEVVVGVDGTPHGHQAIRWAAVEARRRDLPLRLVHVLAPPTVFGAGVDGGRGPAGLATLRRPPEAVLEEAMTLLDSPLGRYANVRTVVVEGHPARVLVEASAGAAVVVVGSRRLGPMGSLVLGSTGAAVAARADCPAVIVRGALADSVVGGGGVVVGVDLSPLSAPVLGYAFEYADRHGLPLRAVLCWTLSSSLVSAWSHAEADAEGFGASGLTMLNEELAGWREKYPEVQVRSVVRYVHPTVGLTTEAQSAALLVVGAQNRHPRLATFLGSVSQGVLHHATCPVAVVHPGD